MASQQQVQVPPRYARVNAWVISRDTDAEVRWLAAVFGAPGGDTPRPGIAGTGSPGMNITRSA